MQDIIDAVHVFSFLVPLFSEMTTGELSKEIENTFSLENPNNAYYYNMLQSQPDHIVKRYPGNTTITFVQH